MSLCNTFRLCALTIVLSVIDTPANTFTIISRPGEYSGTIDDLKQQQTIRLEVRDDLRGPNYVRAIKGDTDNKDYTTTLQIPYVNDQTPEHSGPLKSFEYNTNEFSDKLTTGTNDDIFYAESSNNIEITKNNDDPVTIVEVNKDETTTSPTESINDEVDHSKYEKYGQISQNFSSTESPTVPSWKRYTSIIRKPDKNKSEGMITNESGNPGQDSKSGDIPSLNQIKNIFSFFKSDAQNDTRNSKEVTESFGKDNIVPKQESSTTLSSSDKETPTTVESKRGGFLDFSIKSLFEDNDDKKDTSQENNSRTKNRKLSWRFGSRYRGKDDSSSEKQGRLRFRLRNDDDKNNDRKKDKNDMKTIKESEEENKEEESKEQRNDKDKNINTKQNNDNNRTDRNMKESKENYTKDVTTEKSKSRNNKEEKERKDNDRKEDKNNNDRDSKEKNQKDKNERSQSKQRDDKETSRDKSKDNDKDNKRREEKNREKFDKKSEDISIWKTDSKEDRSRLKNKQDHRNDKLDNENRKEDRNLDTKNTEQQRNNERGGEKNRSRNRNQDDTSKERLNVEVRKENNENRERLRNSNERNGESRKKENNDSKEDRNRSRSKSSNERFDESRRKDNNDSREEKNRARSRNDENNDETRKRVTSSAEIENKTPVLINDAIKIYNELPEKVEDTTEYNINSQIPKLDELNKKLSTIDEEDEIETEHRKVLGTQEVTTSEPEYTDVPITVTSNYPPDFKLNNKENEQEALEPKNPNEIINTVVPTTNRVLITDEYVQSDKNQEFDVKPTKGIDLSPIKDDSTKIIFKDDDINRSSLGDMNTITNVPQKVKNDYTTEKPRSTLPPSPSPSTVQILDYGERRGTTLYDDDDSNIRSSGKETESIIQMNEDAIKEELLKEEIINNYEENLGRYKGVSVETTTTQPTIPVRIYEVTKPVLEKTKTSIEEKLLSVKPLNILEKLKTTILFPVGPNYKPPKKIDVQPPKTFVRDPDDNSWRNESLSSLGIVFNPKNSSKPLTQVLKNKTETEWNNLSEKNNKNETPDLRERLEKIAEMRKTKKKKTDAYGNVVYSDYEENSSKENTYSKERETTTSTPAPTKLTTKVTTQMTTPAPTTTSELPSTSTTLKAVTETKPDPPKATTQKPKKIFNVAEYYDTAEDDDADYMTMAKIDLKKFTPPLNHHTKEVITPPTWPITNNRYVHNKYDDRKPTLQYFPPLTTQKAIYNKESPKEFNNKMNAYTYTEPPTNVIPMSYGTKPTTKPKVIHEHMFAPKLKSTFGGSLTTKPDEFAKDFYMTPAPGVTVSKEPYTYVTDDGSFNKASDVIKHYRDFLNAVAKDHEEDKNLGYTPYAQIPTQGVTVGHTLFTKPDDFKPEIVSENEDYDTDYRKDVLQRFVHNFNQNSERFKPNLPLLYNNSIIHSPIPAENGRDVASSRAYFSKLLNRPEGDCDNSTVELSPAYELHYYVPEQEEKEEVDPKAVTLPYPYRL